jgi:hypothetical protein
VIAGKMPALELNGATGIHWSAFKRFDHDHEAVRIFGEDRGAVLWNFF